MSQFDSCAFPPFNRVNPRPHRCRIVAHPLHGSGVLGTCWALALILLISSPAIAFDSWTKTEVVMEAAYLGLLVVDWGQTLDIADDQRYHEDVNCSLLGKRPSRGRVNAVFAIGMVAHPVIAHVLPHKWRKAWIASGITLEAACGVNNHNLGLKVNF